MQTSLYARRTAERNRSFKQNYVQKNGSLVYVKPKPQPVPKQTSSKPISCDSTELIVVTREMILFGQTRNGGFRPKSIRILGLEIRKGWIEKAVGKRIRYAAWCRFVHFNRKYWPTTDDALELSKSQ